MSAVQSLPDLPDLPERDRSAVTGYELALELRGSVALLTVTGTLDGSSADAIEGIVCAEGPVSGPVHIVAAGITAVDPLALDLVIAATRERVQRGLPAVSVIALSRPMGRALRELGLSDETPVALSG
jgi:hypothetical protein